MVLPDYHLHTPLCGHAEGKLDAYARAAVVAGLPEICFTDHLPLYWLAPENRPAGLAMSEEELPVYWQQLTELQKEFCALRIKIGIEADYIPGREEALQRLLHSYPFDYVLGSVHFIGQWCCDHPDQVVEYSRRRLEDIYEEYFTLLIQAIRSRLFDAVAHPDLIKKFGHRLPAPPLKLYRAVAEELAANGVCVELNTAGWRYPSAEAYPAPDFLRACAQLGVPVLLGSDAHTPQHVAWMWPEAMTLLREVGYRAVAVFTRRHRQILLIDAVQ